MRVTQLSLFLALSHSLLGQVVITEFMASNKSSLRDENGERSDWIEIQNQGNESINLEGWTLTNNLVDRAKWVFPVRQLSSGERLIVFASGREVAEQNAASNELHTNFTLKQSGGYLGLFSPNASTASSEFTPTYPPQYTDISYGVGSLGQMLNVDLTPENPEQGVDWDTVVLGGVSGDRVVSLDSGKVGGSQQSYPWFEYRDELATLADDLVIVSATLTWEGTGLERSRRLLLKDSNVGVFPVPDAAKGIDSMPEPYDGNNIRNFYQNNPRQDEVYVQADRVTRRHSWDVTRLVAQWHSTPNFPQEGEFLLLNDSFPIRIFWGNSLQPMPSLEVSAFQANSELEQNLYFPNPSPSNANYNGKLNLVEDTKFSKKRGIYSSDFEVLVTSGTAGATISYTTDGSTPTPDHGTLIPSANSSIGPVAQVTISGTTTLRAIAFRENWASSNVDTQTYLFTNQVADQGNSPEGYPTEWKGDGGQGVISADYEIDSEILDDASYADDFVAALEEIPTVSLVTDIAHLFDPDTGIYQNPQQSGGAWERPCSMEILYPSDASENVQIDCGLRIQGGHTRLPSNNPKHSFRVSFRSEYGDSKFEHRLFGAQRTATKVFDELILRAGGNQSWLHHNTFLGDNRGRAQYLRDQWAKDVRRDMGHPSTHNMYAHLYINGIYWGLYNPTERATSGFGDEYLDGGKDDFDALNSGSVVSGNNEYFDEMFSIAEAGLSDLSRYQEISERLDLVSFADYMILNQYGGNKDWDDHNWYAIANRNGGKWHYIAWDSEFFFIDLADNFIEPRSANADRRPSDLWKALMENEEFRILFMDRVHFHCANSGMLTPDQVRATWDRRKQEMFFPIIGESARWGDYRRDVHQRGTPTPIPLYDRDEEWQAEYNRLVNSYFPQRTGIYLNHLEEARILPGTKAPSFSQHGGFLPTGDSLTILSASGDIYYTLDGSDPRAEGGDVLGMLYSDPLIMDRSAKVTARARSEGGEWSPATSAFFFSEMPASASNLVISEIMYNQVGSDDSEFIELWNRSETDVIDLSGVQFVAGISFVFEANTTLAPNERAVLTRSAEAFRVKYGDGVRILGEFATGTALGNSGDRLELQGAAGEEILNFRYETVGAWPERADGGGSSLVLVDSLSYQEPASWKLSSRDGGSPGATDTIAFTGDPMVDADNDGLNAGFEYLLGSSDESYSPLGEILRLEVGESWVTVKCPLNLFAEERLLVTYSNDLKDWSKQARILEQVWQGEGQAELLVRIPKSQASYFRVEKKSLR